MWGIWCVKRRGDYSEWLTANGKRAEYGSEADALRHLCEALQAEVLSREYDYRARRLST